MTRTTSFLVDDFSAQVADATGLVQAAESSSAFLYTKRLYIYEAAYLLVFSAWENLLEQSFLRFLCGYSNGAGALTKNGTWTRPNSIAAADTMVLGRKQFTLWHNPTYVIGRSKGYFVSGPHEAILASALGEIECFAAIRHFVAHRNRDTGIKFQAAATRLSGAPVLGGRAGRLLRTRTMDTVTGADVTWFERISADLVRYATQVAG